MSKERVVSVRVTEEEYQRLNRQAKARKQTISKYLRELLFPNPMSYEFRSQTNTYTYPIGGGNYMITYQ